MRLGLNNLPLAQVNPDVDSIRQHVYAMKHGEESEPIEAEITYISHGGKLVRIIGIFGMYATFVNRDLAFQVDDPSNLENHTGVLFVEGNDVRVSTPRTGRTL